MIGYLGELVFEVSDKKVLTFSDFTRSVGSNWTTHQLIDGKPHSEYIGGKLQSINFSVKFTAALGVRPRQMLQKLEKMAEGREVFPLVIGGRPVGKNQWKITAVSETWGAILNRGEIVSASVAITLEEYE